MFAFVLDGISFEYSMEYTLEKKEDKDYIKPVKDSLVFETDQGYYHLDNLFEGNKVLGKKIKIKLIIQLPRRRQKYTYT